MANAQTMPTDFMIFCLTWPAGFGFADFSGAARLWDERGELARRNPLVHCPATRVA
ncbi:MAG: hypothetical protein LBD06_03795 [Candidatus Accumulibacter sp.]|nr:hypothetical protein [Accumulibacter sp.]